MQVETTTVGVRVVDGGGGVTVQRSGVTSGDPFQNTSILPVPQAEFKKWTIQKFHRTTRLSTQPAYADYNSAAAEIVSYMFLYKSRVTLRRINDNDL